MEMLDDFVMNFSWEELEDEYYTIEDYEYDYLMNEREKENGKDYTKV